MKQKVLINGRNQILVSEFIQQTASLFDTVTTSAVMGDITMHFNFFKPDVYVVIMEGSYEQVIQQLTKVKENIYYNGAVVVLIGDADACSQIERRSKDIANLLIRRPVTADNLALRITRYMEDYNEARSRQASHAEKMDQADALIKAAEAALSSAASAAAASPASGGRKHILVVDDDRTVLKMLKSALETTYDVTTMANGAMIEKLLVAKQVDLIILDYEMPIETGAEIFRRIRKKPAWVNIPVCFLTGVSDREKIMEVMSLKPHGYILKPIDMDMLSATIKNLLG